MFRWGKRDNYLRCDISVYFSDKKLNNQIFIIKDWGLKGKWLAICQLLHCGTQSLCKSFALVGFVGWRLGVFQLQFEVLTHKSQGSWIFIMLPCDTRNQLQLEWKRARFAQQPGEQSQNFPHTWTGLWVCNKAEHKPSFSWLCYQAFLHRSIIHCINFSFLKKKKILLVFLKQTFRRKKKKKVFWGRKCKSNSSVSQQLGDASLQWAVPPQHPSSYKHRLIASNVGQCGEGKKKKR